MASDLCVLHGILPQTGKDVEIRLARSEVTEERLARFFDMEVGTLYVENRRTKRTFLPGTNGDFSGLPAGEHFTVNGERCAPSSFRSSSGHRPQAPRSMIRPTTFARKTDLETPFGWHTSSSASFGLGSSGSSRSLADFRPSATSTVQQDAGSRPVGRKFTTRKVNVVKFDGTQKSGRRSHIQQGAPWLIRCPAVCTVRRLTDLVKKKAISQGVSPDMEFILSDSSGCALQDDERPDDYARYLQLRVTILRDTLESVYLSQNNSLVAPPRDRNPKKEEALQIRWERGDCSRAQ